MSEPFKFATKEQTLEALQIGEMLSTCWISFYGHATTTFENNTSMPNDVLIAVIKACGELLSY